MQSDVWSVEAVRAGVVGRLRARLGEIEEAIFARVRGDAFGLVGARDAEYVAGLRAAVVAALGYALAGIERGDEEVGQVPVVAVEQARRAARVGVSLDTVLRRYVVGSALLEEFVLEEADRGEGPADREALRGALRVQASALERLLESITDEYRDELARAGRSPEWRAAERVRALLLTGGSTGVGMAGDGSAGEGATRDVVERELDYELDAWHLGVIARGVGAREVVCGLAASLDRRSLCVASGEDTVWGWLGGQRRLEVAALERAVSELEWAYPVRTPDRAGHPDQVMHGLPAAASLVAGEPARGLAGWRLTHQQAQAALVVALRQNGIPRNGIPRSGIPPTREGVTFTRYVDVALLASALKDQVLARTLLDVYLTPLDDAHDRGPVLRETLRVYLAAECSVSSAAAALNLARSTVEKRLRTIEEKLGRTLHPCPAELGVALGLYDLGAVESSSG
jgi:PucR-like helix-turn-helix protein